MIDIKTLTKSDIGRPVVYKAFDRATPQQGKITSFNDRYIFVDYDGTGRGQATPADKLDFIKKTTQDAVDDAQKAAGELGKAISESWLGRLIDKIIRFFTG